MKRFHSLRPALAAALFLASASLTLFSCSSVPSAPPAAPTAVAAKKDEWAQPHYFAVQAPTLKAEEWIPAPPADGSPLDRKDMETLLHFQKIRTKAECETSALQRIPTYEAVFGHVLDPAQDAKRIEAVRALFNNVSHDVFYVTEEVKQHWKRQRPYLRNPKIQPCIYHESSFSYPSGHASLGYIEGEVLAELFPKEAAAFRKAGQKAGANRILGGVHHPSDIEAGVRIGKEVLAELRRNPAFQADFAAVVASLRP